MRLLKIWVDKGYQGELALWFDEQWAIELEVVATEKDQKGFAVQPRSIAQLGGFIGRKSDGFPRVKVLWRGWQRLNDLVAMWVVFHPSPKDVGNV